MKSRRTLLAAVFAVVLASGIAAVWELIYIPRRYPNVIVIVVDTVRADHLPFYGYRRMTAPFLHEFASRASVFDAWSPTSWTKPAVASLLTGLHPIRHQTYGRADKLSPGVQPLAEILRQRGYYTAGFTANIWTSGNFDFNRGFDVYKTIEDSDAGRTDEGPDGARVNSQVFPEIDRAKCPCFFFIHYVDPHIPYRPRKGWDGSVLSGSDAKGLGLSDLQPDEFVNRPATLVQKAVDLYDGEIRQSDENIEAVLGALKRKGMLRNAIVVVTSDHGEEFQEHGRMGHGQTVYEEVTRVPLIISAPDSSPGRRSGAANLIDIVPTILDLLRFPPAAVDGVSLAPALRQGTAIPPRDFLTHLDFQDSPRGANGVRFSNAALGYTHGAEKLVLSKRPFKKEFFDLGNDKRERNNLIDRSDHVTSIAKLLSESYNNLSRRRAKRVNINVGDETQHAIEALGYLAGAGTREEQTIPVSIRPADPDPEGDLGWSSGDQCIDLSDIRAESQLLRGWHAAESSGRWMKGDSTMLLPLSDTTLKQVSIKGFNGRPDQFDLIVSVRDVVLATRHIGTGVFSLAVPLPEERRSNVLRIRTSSTYVPSEHGGADERSLGVLLTSVCAEE